MNYETQLNRLNVKAAAGYDYQKYDDQHFGMNASGFITDLYGYNNIGAASSWKDGLGTAYSDRSEHKLIGMFGNVQLNYNNTYFVSANVRREGSSRLADAQKWGLFYGMSAGMDLQPIIRVRWINQLKLRIGFGQTGNIPFASYLSKAIVQPGASYFYNGNFSTAGYILVRQANPNLKEETSTDRNFGVDFAFLKYRFRGSLDFYKKESRDLIYQNPSIDPNLAPTWMNTGQLTNKGFELKLDYRIFTSTKFQWTTGFNMATFNTTIGSVLDNGATFRTAYPDPPCGCGVAMISVASAARVGQLSAPIFNGTDLSGSPTYLDLNGDGKGDIWTDLATVGNGLPTMTYGWSHSVKLGRWGLDIGLRGARGHHLVNSFRLSFENASRSDILNWNRVQTQHWIPELRRTDYSNLYVEQANYLKLDNITFSFDVAKDASKGKVFVTANNWWVTSNYSGVDPEVRYADAGSSSNSYLPVRYLNPDPLAPGIDRQATYWRTRSVTVGVNLTF
ncbi:MAG: hypothetical protein RIS64_2650 [Bacteroidota bacterium]